MLICNGIDVQTERGGRRAGENVESGRESGGVKVINFLYCPFYFSYVSRLVECVDPQLVESHSAALGKWLAETSNDVTVKLSSRCCEHLYLMFTKKEQWNYVVELFSCCSRYVHELGPKVHEPLVTALQHLGPTDKLIGIAETLTEDQMARMSSEVSIW